eukprot:gene40075-21182_t
MSFASHPATAAAAAPAAAAAVGGGGARDGADALSKLQQQLQELDVLRAGCGALTEAEFQQCREQELRKAESAQLLSSV